MPVPVDHNDDKAVEALFIKVKEENHGQLDILVNNAGVFYIEEDGGFPLKKHTEDGLELAVGTNFFGHALLIHCLMRLLKGPQAKANDPSRILNLTSFGHIQGTLKIS